MNSLYIAFSVIWILAFIMIYNAITLKNNTSVNLHKFDNTLLNEIYQLSFGFPFKHFVEDDNNLEPKGKILQKQLEDSNFNRYFSVRSYMAFKVIFLMICLLMAGLVTLITLHSSFFIKIFFNIQSTATTATSAIPKGGNIKSIVIIFCFFLFISLIPNFILKQKVKKTLVANTKDIPILQMFIILMLRSNKTIVEILYALSKLNTNHKEAFEHAYRIYIRNKQEGLDFLKHHFVHANARFVETFNLLNDVGEYAREECIRILESNMKAIVDDTNTMKRRNDMSKLIYSQASMMIPFTTLITLGAVPLIVMGLGIFANSGLGK